MASKTVPQFLGKLEKAPKLLNEARKDMVVRSALLVTTSIRTEIQHVAPGGRMRGVGKRGAKVGARFVVKPGREPSALITAQGPLHLLERDTKAHEVGIARVRGRRAGKAPVLKIGDDFVRGPIHHPGTKGKHPFEKGADRGRTLVPVVMQRSVHSSLAKVFTG